MFSFGRLAQRQRTAARTSRTAAALVLALAAGPALAQSIPPEQATPTDQAAPAAAAETAAETPSESPPPAPAATEPEGPKKPVINQAIRDALARDEGDTRSLPPQLRALRQAVNAYYAKRGDAPVWIAQGQWTPAAHAAFEQLQRAPNDGLDLRAYRVYTLDQAPESVLALGEVALSEAVAAYAFQASGGRLDPARISHLIGARPAVASAGEALDATSKSADADRTLQAYNPQQPGYLALKEKLAQLRAAPAPMARAPAVSARMARLASTEHGRRASDAAWSAAARHDAELEGDILTNMEFWRWLPRDLGADRVVVNIPEFTARYYRDNALVLPIRVITGKPDKPTPLFSNKIEYLIVNPSWNVPQSIIKNELMSHLDALRAQGYEIRYVGGRLHVRQPPGERNALGRIKFMFPNDYAVYMHDTPTRNLFSQSRRAFSHGCVRVDQPFKFAETLLGPERGWTEARIKKLLGPSERRVPLPAPTPIHIVYFTVATDDSGQIRRFDDIYGYGHKARELLGFGSLAQAAP